MSMRVYANQHRATGPTFPNHAKTKPFNNMFQDLTLFITAFAMAGTIIWAACHMANKTR